jgi:hypothetical protein
MPRLISGLHGAHTEPLDPRGFLFNCSGKRHVFNFQPDKAQAQALAQSISAQVPSILLRENRKALSVNKITRVLEKAFLQAGTYQAQHRMGFVRRSLFAHAFQWTLKEQAYPADFVAMATEGLVVAVSAKPVGAATQRAR